ncbi:MAG TPA: tetratricopeptide repeat protein [Bryobacteraceae bacterium]|nr:tetratricopeptide repeat protein [Bryobacteraceae bacterium]
MAAINASGYNADAASPNNNPLRETIRKELAAKQIPSLPALKDFYLEHRQSDPTADLSQYISFALSVKGPPTFAPKGREAEIPPDAAALDGFGPLLAKFYREAGIEDLWNRSQPAFDQAIERYHELVADAVLQVNGFLRNETSGTSSSWFQIYVDLLGAPNQIQTRSYGRNYYVVITPSAEPRIRDVRHAYLHYLLDPLAARHEEIVMRKRGLADHAQRAPALDQSFKSDYLLLVTESLIKAVEARLDRQPAAVNQAMREGYILTAFFAEQLQPYLKQEQAMRFYYPEMIAAIDLKREDARLSQIDFVSEAPVRPVKVVELPRPPEPKGVYKTLAQAEQLYSERSLEAARQLFLKALEETGEHPLHAQAYYGLARIAALEKNPEMAERLFRKVLESGPEPRIRAWTLVYLARLSDAAGDREQATRHYREALAVEGASPAAHDAAEQGVQRSFEKKSN